MVKNPFRFDGRSVLVIGASSGIGAATSRLANSLGATVVLTSRTERALAAVQDTLDFPDASQIVVADYLDPESLLHGLDLVSSIDHLLISAVADENKKRGRFVDLSDATMRASFYKYWGQIHSIRAALPKLSEKASITLFSSIAGFNPTAPEAGLAVMNSVQAAVIQLGRSLARELAPRRVNILAPGVVLTGVWEASKQEDLRVWMERDLPARHAGRPEDIALAAVSLMLNPYITGAVLTVDGGLSLQ